MGPSDQDRDGRNAAARGYILAMRVMTVSIQMAVPPGVGWWVDQRYGTSPWVTLLGVVLGFSMAMLELMKLTKGR